MSVAILTESGGGIGFGHVVRMSVLAQAFEKVGINCQRLVNHRGPRDSNCQILDEWVTKDWLCDDMSSVFGKCDAVVIDSYLADGDFFRSFSEGGMNLVAIDDYDRLEYAADLVINPNPYARTRSDFWLGGVDYVLLRKEVRRQLGSYQLRHSVKRVLVTLGGDDPHHLLPEIATLLDRFDLDVSMISAQKDSDSPGNWLGRLNGSEIVEAFLNADLVISGCGQTLHELAFLGVPTIGFCVGEDQICNQNYYHSIGFIGELLDWRDSDWSINLAQAVRRRIGGEFLGSKCGTIVDGSGGERIANAIAKLRK